MDNAPVNPDEMILQCPNQECRKWQHIKCIAEAAAKTGGVYLPTHYPAYSKPNTDILAAEAHIATASKRSAKKKKTSNDNITIRTNSLAQAKAVKDGTTCEVMIAGSSNNDDQAPAKQSFIEITDPDGEKSVQDVQCLFCGTQID